MQVEVKPFWIENLSPNPATAQVQVAYKADGASSAYIMIINQSGTIINNYILDVNQNYLTINLSSYITGAYSVVLVCDGASCDAKNLIIE